MSTISHQQLQLQPSRSHLACNNATKCTEARRKATEIAAAAAPALANGCSVGDLKNSMQTNGSNSNNNNGKWHCFVPGSCNCNSSIDGLKITHKTCHCRSQQQHAAQYKKKKRKKGATTKFSEWAGPGDVSSRCITWMKKATAIPGQAGRQPQTDTFKSYKRRQMQRRKEHANPSRNWRGSSATGHGQHAGWNSFLPHQAASRQLRPTASGMQKLFSKCWKLLVTVWRAASGRRVIVKANANACDTHGGTRLWCCPKRKERGAPSSRAWIGLARVSTNIC